MKLLCFQAKRFHWKTHSKTLPDAPEEEVDEAVESALVAFLHAEIQDAEEQRQSSVQRRAIKHIKWLANKRQLKNVVLHAFAHLGAEPASPELAQRSILALAERLRENGYRVWITPFGYFCEWDLSVHGESLAKVWKEIN
ncbi:MAG TPA: threonyl-tRNA synthetase editing domain-containing protein [Candidatus Binatia bacterium]|nr:threonyl-tRNA synthetase editing domain-containing protein [Candidatus Binatia bacterium]